MSVDMDICSESSVNDEEDENEEELDLLLNSLNGIEKCFLSSATENFSKKIEEVPNVDHEDLTNITKPSVLDTVEYIPNDSNKDKASTDENTPHNSSFHEYQAEFNFNVESLKEVPLPQKPIEKVAVGVCDEFTLSSSDEQKSLFIDTSRENSDSDVIIDKVYATQINDRAVQQSSLENQSKTDKITSVSSPKKIDSSDSDVDIVEHIQGSPYLKKGFIDLTLEDETAKGTEDTIEIEEQDDTEIILKEINKIKRALLRHKKKKRKKRKRDDRKTHSRTRSSSRSAFVDSDEDKIQARVYSSIELPFGRSHISKSKSKSPDYDADDRLRYRNPSSDRSPCRARPRARSRSRSNDRCRSRTQLRARSRSNDRSRSRARLRARSRARSRSIPRSRSPGRNRNRRSRDKFHDRRTPPPRSYTTSSKSQLRPRRKKSSSDSDKRRRESPLECVRKKLRKENESAVKSLVSVNSVHQQIVNRDGNQTITDVRASTIIQESLIAADITQSFAAKDQTNLSRDSSINQQVMMDSHPTQHLVTNLSAQQSPPNYDARLEPNYPDYYPPVGQTMYHQRYYSQVNVLQINRLYCPNYEYLMPYSYYHY